MNLENKLSDAVWAAANLFNRSKTSGSSANISFMDNGKIYISASGACFGTLTPSDFAVMSIDGSSLSSKRPSKEFPLHQMLYQKDPSIQAVIHTHSTFSVLWSFSNYAAEHSADCIPPLTPYLKMKLGTIGLIPYKQPGTSELFSEFSNRILSSDGFLLKQHGPVVPGKSILDAFYCLEELEESCKIAWMAFYGMNIDPSLF